MQYLYRDSATQKTLFRITFYTDDDGKQTLYSPVPRQGELVMIDGERMVQRVIHDVIGSQIIIDLGIPL